MSDTEILNKELETLAKYGTYNITVKEIYDGKLLGGNQIKTATADEINAKIGTVVSGYSAKDLEWQVYFADEVETYLITKTIAFEGSITTNIWNLEYQYAGGSDDVKNSFYGSKWNDKWLTKCTLDTENGGKSILQNAKATAYLCDTENWKDYVSSSASYAVGGPTIELFIASYNKSQGTNIQLNDSDITAAGFAYNIPNELYNSESLQSSINNGVYYFGSSYWLASPSTTDDSNAGKLKGIDNTGACTRNYRKL